MMKTAVSRCYSGGQDKEDMMGEGGKRGQGRGRARLSFQVMC